ncbi:MAG: hypothetical protein IJN71_01385, partial [Oscillospiraceae bacterium]|nr:hypothetical protein [Oscillospiraceae bacterium]
ILALSLLVGLVPSAFAATEATDTIIFDFDNSSHEKTKGYTNKEVARFETDGYQGLHDIEDTVSSVSAPWGYVAQSFPNGVNTIATEVDGIRLSYNRKAASPITFNPDASGSVTAFCVELTVGASGEYTPTIATASFATQTAPIVEFYLVPKTAVAEPIVNGNLSDIVKGLDAKYRMGVVDTLKDGVAGTYDTTFRRLSLNAGNYYLIVVPNGENENALKTGKYYYFVIKSLMLEPASAAEYDYILTTDQTTGGIDVDTDGEGADTGMPVDTTLANAGSAASAAGNSEIGIWKYSGVYRLYNAAIPRFMGDYTYVNTANSSNWAYVNVTNQASAYIDNIGAYMTTRKFDGTGYFVLKLQIEQPGAYDLSFVHNDVSGCEGQIYFSFFPVSGNQLNAATIKTNKVGNSLDLYTLAAADGVQSAGKVTATASGDYYLAVVFDGKGSIDTDKDFRGVHIKSVHLKKSADAAQPGDAEVNVDPGNSEADVSGVGTTPTINTLAADVFGTPLTVEGIDKSDSYVSAPKTFGNYEFLYWTKDIGYNKKIVSHNEKYDFIATPGRTIFTAVYREIGVDTPEKAVFYNANGDIVSTVAIADGAVVAPALTSMAGFGASVGWKLVSTGEIYGAGESVPANGEMLFVAEYNTLSANISVTVNGGSGTGTYTYGDTVTASAPSRKTAGSTEVFNYWTKTVGSKTEIVSFKKDYTFSAWETCTLTAVYSDYVPVAEKVRKVLLSSVMIGGEETVVAEFIGFEDAVERGIAFGTGDAAPSYASLKRSVMNSKDLNQLAVINDEGYSYKAYVITEDGEVHYSK